MNEYEYIHSYIFIYILYLLYNIHFNILFTSIYTCKTVNKSIWAICNLNVVYHLYI